MENIPSPRELLGECVAPASQSNELKELIAFCLRNLEEHKDDIRRGQTLRMMVSATTSREDIEALLSLFWQAGWQVSYLSCPPRPHQLFFCRPKLYGGWSGNMHQSIH